MTRETAKTASVRSKVMLRMDRRFREHGLRQYRGYEQRGSQVARLNFDNQTIEVGAFGSLRRASHVCC